MKTRKHKKTTAKLGLLFVVLVFSLASIGASHSWWNDTLTIHGTITTGTWEEDETAWARMNDDPDVTTYDFPGDNWATYIKCIPGETIQTFYLYAGQHYRVGELIVWKDTTHLFVKYDLDDGYDMSVSHLHVNTSLEGIPQNNGGPIPGQFDYSEDHDPRVIEYTYQIPWDQSWNNVEFLYIAAHAVVWGFFL